MLRDLAPLLERRLAFGVVPNWHGEWPLAVHADYCRLVQEVAQKNCFFTAINISVSMAGGRPRGSPRAATK